MSRRPYRIAFWYVLFLAVGCSGGLVAGLALSKWGVALFCAFGVVVFGWTSWMISSSHLSRPPSGLVLRYQNGLMKLLRIDSAVSPNQRRRKSRPND